MFESHFGFSAQPFQLSPDPSFYFESKGHGQALAYLKYGVHQREGFIVVTGEIGSGKTTLVRALLEGLDTQDVVAAQVVNTQLDSYDLLQAICTAFGVPMSGTSKAQLLATPGGVLHRAGGQAATGAAGDRRGAEPGHQGSRRTAHAVQLPARLPSAAAELSGGPAGIAGRCFARAGWSNCASGSSPHATWGR